MDSRTVKGTTGCRLSGVIGGRRQSGQAAFEFVFAMLWIICLASVLFQAMHFELDVFNKMNTLRYNVFKVARENQNTTAYRTINQSIQGKPLSDLTGYRVPFQTTDQSLFYGPKKFYVGCGTKTNAFIGPATTAFKVAAVIGLTADHYEPTSGNFGTVISGLSSVTGAVGGVCP